MKKGLKVFLIVIAIILGVAIIGFVVFFGILTIKEWKPADVEKVEVSKGTEEAKQGEAFDVLTFNTGYGALSSDQDCYFDGGETVIPENKELIERNIAGMANIIKEENAKINLLQEVDIDAKRSYHIDQKKFFEDTLGKDSMFACNFNVWYVPFHKGMGNVNAGLVTMTDLKTSDAERLSLPNPWSWPTRTCNLKRCLLVSRHPIANSDKELVIVNLHLEAYDSGEGKIAQTKMLGEVLSKEYAKGNYVIAGGDFNQVFEPVEKAIPFTEDTIANKKWTPGTIMNSDLPQGFSFAVSDNGPTCRLDDTALKDTTQKYIIDGFIVSDNVVVNKVENLQKGFEFTDHNPVKLNVTLK